MKKILFVVLCIFMIAPSASAQSWGNPYRHTNQKRCHQLRSIPPCNYQQPYYQQYSYGTVYPQQYGNINYSSVQNYGGNWSPYSGYQYTSYNSVQQYGQQNMYSNQYSYGYSQYQTQQWGQQGYGNNYYVPARPNFAQLGAGVEIILQSLNR